MTGVRVRERFAGLAVALAAAVVLAGCASYPPTPANNAASTVFSASDEAPITAGVPLATVPAVVVGLYLQAERDAILGMWADTPHAENTSTSNITDGVLTIALSADAWFMPDSGQFRISALGPFTSLASVLARHSAQVIWVIGRGPDAGDPDGLSARRAAAAAAVLDRNGVEAERLRFITRPLAQGDLPTLAVIAVPLQSGAIPDSFMPPE
ncbi:MAG: hypothetical protein EPN72_10375 [Nevskiaceae bacterium]|nr:MAG: hypothetical protein EPN61_01975 [Burkholderiaceae bacterium]TBR72356.1 MAG: hypothetical protein EPN72_10375 [Nevskiaceae bacterium]